ncbi:hypothetical protein CEXT_475571 [Caerostris extrusa]|uniref:Uncharacterized protein n=1 Tax=Caerostris extrusa TaxID=172846 RepID=A0AAV4Y416_CAEEX|nr:hypothetical protein CEXT_475571 [Caerostris extrusa]
MINDLNSTVVNDYPSNRRQSKNSTGHYHKKKRNQHRSYSGGDIKSGLEGEKQRKERRKGIFWYQEYIIVERKDFFLPLFADTSFVFSTVGREGRLI